MRLSTLVISVPLSTLITVLDLVHLGVVINSKLKLNDHCQYVVSKLGHQEFKSFVSSYVWLYTES